MIVNERMKKRREELGLSGAAIAKLIGKPKGTYYRYETGHIKKIPSAELEPLAKALRTTPAYLLGLTDDPSPNAAAPVPSMTEAEAELLKLWHSLPDELALQVLQYIRFLLAQQEN